MKFAAAMAVLALALLASCTPDRRQGSPALKYDVRKETRSYGSCDTANTPCVQVSCSYPVLDDAVASPLRDSIGLFLTSEVFASLEDPEVAVTFDTLAGVLIEQFKELKAEFADYRTPWRLTRSATVIADTQGFVSLRFSEDSYLGGAHGMEIVRLTSFDAATGKRLGPADFFAPGSDSALSAAVEKGFRLARNVPAHESLQDAGFWVEDGRFPVGENIAVGKGEMIFYYNAYEIAPYALGPTEVRIPLAQLGALLSRGRFPPGSG